MSIVKEEKIIFDEEFVQDIKYPIHIGPVFKCIFCNTNFISLDFLKKHSIKCILQNISILSKIKFFYENSKEKSIEKKKNQHKSHETKDSNDKLKTNNTFQVSSKSIILDDLNDKAYQCDICNKRFPKSSALKIHIKTHSGEKPFQCDICKKRFTRNLSLQDHYRIHTGEKPFKCDICNKQFAQNSNLRRHISMHIGKKPFECDRCHKQFSQRHNLNEHYRIHTAVKPFLCNKCKKGFTQSSGLKNHMRKHANEKLCLKL